MEMALELLRDGDSFGKMSTANSLSDEQIATIRSWAEDGDQLSDIQKRLGDELEIKVTYLETRFLLEDLGIELQTEPEPEEEEEEATEESPEADAAEGAEDETAGEGGVSVTVDKIQRPGAVISGRVDFGGGKTSAWWIDQNGSVSEWTTTTPAFAPARNRRWPSSRNCRRPFRKAASSRMRNVAEDENLPERHTKYRTFALLRAGIFPSSATDSLLERVADQLHVA